MLLPCMLGYGMIARRLYDDSKTVREGNKYFRWIEEYISEGYTKAVEVGRGQLQLRQMILADG